jgi:hypothetical protein
MLSPRSSYIRVAEMGTSMSNGESWPVLATRRHVVEDIFWSLHRPMQVGSMLYRLLWTEQKNRGCDFWTEQKKRGCDFWLMATLLVWLRMTVQKKNG